MIKLKKTLDTIVEREEPNITEEEFKEIPRLVKSWYYKLENSFPILSFGLQSSSIPYNEYIITESLVAMYNNVKEKIEEIIIAKESQDQPTYHHFEFLILAHGHIVKDFLPSSDYYRYNIYDVKTFVPWGSLLHASAAASILIGEAKPENMSYEFGKSEKANLYRTWRKEVKKVEKITSFKVLPKNRTKIPTIILKPTDEDEPVIKATEIFMKSDRKQEDLEYAVYIPYYNTSKICFRHHDLPLFAINAILSLICDMLDVEPSTSKGITRDITCDINILCCLKAERRDGFDENVPVEVNEHYSTIPNDNVEVRSHTQISSKVLEAFEELLSSEQR